MLCTLSYQLTYECIKYFERHRINGGLPQGSTECNEMRTGIQIIYTWKTAVHESHACNCVIKYYEYRSYVVEYYSSTALFAFVSTVVLHL